MMTNRQARNRAGWALAVGLSVVAAPAALLALPAPAPVGVEGVRGAVAEWVSAQQPGRAVLLPAPRDTISAGAPYAYRPEELDRRPRLINPGEIQSLLSRLYPAELQAAKVGGTAVMQYAVAADGTVDPSTIRTIRSTDPRFGEASAAAVREFRYRPGTYKGKPVRVLIQTPMTWQPDDGAPAAGGQGVGVRRDTVPRSPADFSGIGRADAAPRDTTKFLYEVARLDTRPDLLNKQEIMGLMNRFYPSGLREAGIGGSVVVQFVIQPDGAVDPATLRLIGNPNRQLGTASILVAERFRFRPGIRSGKPVRVLIQMPMTWQPDAGGAEASPKGFQELIPPKEPPPAMPGVDTSAPAVDPADFSGMGTAGNRIAGAHNVSAQDFTLTSHGVDGATKTVRARGYLLRNDSRITGRVLDRDGHPASGVIVSVPALPRGALTGDDGRFAIMVPAGTHVLNVSAPGWAAQLTRSVSVAAGQTETVEIRGPSRGDALDIPGLLRGGTRE